MHLFFRALTSAISVHYLAKKREEKQERDQRKVGSACQVSEGRVLETTSKYKMTEEAVLALADLTARQYQMFLGLDTLPRLLLQNLSNKKKIRAGEARKTYHLPGENTCTGRILINLHRIPGKTPDGA